MKTILTTSQIKLVAALAAAAPLAAPLGNGTWH
jgi:hypothetical protein